MARRALPLPWGLPSVAVCGTTAQVNRGAQGARGGRGLRDGGGGAGSAPPPPPPVTVVF